MPPKTRRSQPKAADSEPEAVTTGKTLPPSSTNPPLLFVLPENRSKDSRILTLPHPATTNPVRFFFCPDDGIYEFRRIAAPKKAPRSWLLAPEEHEDTGGRQAPSLVEEHDVSKGFAIEQPDLFVATPMDPLFMLLPALAADIQEDAPKLFLSLDDHLDNLPPSKHLQHVLQSATFRVTLEKRTMAVCDHVEVGNEKMYRLSVERVVRELVKKAEKMVVNGLPASMEHDLVQEALQRPVPIIVRQESSSGLEVEPATDSQSSVPSMPAGDPQASVLSAMTVETDVTSTSTVSARNHGASDEVVRLLRVRTALDTMLTSYVAPTLRGQVQSVLSSKKAPVDFKPLDDYLQQLTSMRKEVQALRSLSDNISRKRSHVDEEVEAAREEKRRKKEEEEAKKKNQSRGTKQLAKVNTSGMQKLSSFFTKAPAKKAKS